MKRLLFFSILFIISTLVSAQVKRVAILETIDKEGNIGYAQKLMLRSNLSKAITNTPGYEAYDRTDIDAIVGEQSFQRTGMVSEDQIRKLGEMTGAAYILVAEAVKVDDQNMFITAKILNVESARTEMTDNVLMGITASDVQHGCEMLANKLFGTNYGSQLGGSMPQSNAPVKQPEQQVVSKPKSEPSAIQQTNKINPITPNGNVPVQDQVGSLKNFDDGTYGIIFFLNQNGQGLAVSLDETIIQWENQTKNANCHDVSMLFNEEDCNLAFTCGIGKGYCESIVGELGDGAAPAAGWCVQHGNGWYLPSAGELWKLLIVANKKMGRQGPISQALSKAGGMVLNDGKYWTSNEKNKKEAYWVSTFGDNDEEDKTKAINVRAIRAF